MTIGLGSVEPTKGPKESLPEGLRQTTRGPTGDNLILLHISAAPVLINEGEFDAGLVLEQRPPMMPTFYSLERVTMSSYMAKTKVQM